ncbi:hypothetical protein LIV57_13380 [Chryseobacterium sp. X308]|uniref:hypothetical protein n=1 Tax=Chryseobacterium sp. X308 TaxID=2884873 RepID=UPI001D1495DE|nr:hypothetical protein [Chryseobacterium sp. X308]MCC3216257.1 hypothetical protein [Chryseobacterium sp. X308]
MKHRILMSLLFISSALVSCQDKKAENNKNVTNITESSAGLQFNQDVNTMLKKQLEYGKPSFDNPYQYSDKDLEVATPILNQLLLDNGYKAIRNEEFSNKIKQIFNRIIDKNSTSKFVYINLIDKCDKELNFFPNNAENNGVFVVKNQNFITDLYPLPLIIDYQKTYSEAAQEENSASKNYKDANGNEVKKYLWKDIHNLKEQRKKNIQTLVARNLYLFNDNKAQYKWLTLNDSYFMEALVKTFGYTQDIDLLKWVIERTKFDKKDPSDYGNLFWVKQCDETVKIHANTFKILQEIYTPDITNDMSNENRFLLDYIKGYLEYFADFNNKETGVSKVDKVKILANIVYFAEQYKYDKRFVSGYGDNSKMMGRLRFFLDQEEVDILQKNNYFNLPKFKEWWDNADYDEYFVEECEYNGTCGPDNRPLNMTEWRKQHPKK